MSAPVLPPLYCNSLTRFSRLRTREVKIGDLGIGGNNPIRLQSMTTTDTMDTIATVEQSIRMIEAGCELVRITAPSMNEARNLENIKKELLRRGYKTPVCADIHFTPNAAETAARLVEKVRVNPGNYADKKKFEHIDYTDSAYEEELDRICQRFTPLVNLCKEYGTAMRIGTNHGSLSDRILSRYGDTPLGMVESAVEFLQICEDQGFYNVILSMKASNPQVMVQAYRLLVTRMKERDAAKNSSPELYPGVYPLHLGVTEAGEGEDGRIKSAVGIGALLEDGLGDTVRVSLTEDPEFEIPVAKALVDRYTNRETLQKAIPEIQPASLPYSPFEYERRKTREVLNFGGHQVPRVVADLSSKEKITAASLFPVGYQYSIPLDKWNLTDQACDYIYTGNKILDFEIPGTLGVILNCNSWKDSGDKDRYYPLFTLEEFQSDVPKSDRLNFVSITIDSIVNEIVNRPNVVFILETANVHGMAEQRRMFMELQRQHIQSPVLIKRSYDELDSEDILLHASTDIGSLYIDGFGDGIWIDHAVSETRNLKHLNSLAFGILQATRTRISKTEYISCPSCGRTLFDLQETTARIRSRTDHLKGIKIGIMGCIVNGPGEMADADYGYVGTGPGKITLYKGKEVVKRNVASELAVDELISLIRENGDWIDVKEAALF